MSCWRKKPITVEAFRWTGGIDQEEDPDWICDAIRKGTVLIKAIGNMPKMLIFSNTGVIAVRVGDYVIKGIEGEIYPCKASIFENTYERVNE